VNAQPDGISCGFEMAADSQNQLELQRDLKASFSEAEFASRSRRIAPAAKAPIPLYPAPTSDSAFAEKPIQVSTFSRRVRARVLSSFSLTKCEGRWSAGRRNIVWR
jgi:hypothetical protein